MLGLVSWPHEVVYHSVIVIYCFILGLSLGLYCVGVCHSYVGFYFFDVGSFWEVKADHRIDGIHEIVDIDGLSWGKGEVLELYGLLKR